MKAAEATALEEYTAFDTARQVRGAIKAIKESVDALTDFMNTSPDNDLCQTPITLVTFPRVQLHYSHR